MSAATAEQARWRLLCETVDALSDDEVGVRSADASDLPAMVRLAPYHWATRLIERGSEPRLRLCGAVSLRWSKLEQLWHALDALSDLQNIEALFLAGPGLDSLAARDLAVRVARLPVVERLMVGCPDLGAGLGALFNISRLRALGAVNCGLEGALEAVAEQAESRLADLDLSTNFLRSMDLEQLVRIRGLERLEQLRLAHNKVLGVGAAVLASRLPCELRGLDLEGCQLDNEGLIALAGSSRFSRLERLDMRSCHFGDDGVNALAASAGFPALRELDLGDNVITVAGVHALLGSPHFPALISLNLNDNQIGDDIVEVVRTSGARLSSIELDDAYLSDEARDALEELDVPSLKLSRVR